MNKKEFLQALNDSILVCDGAMGTMLYNHGIFINKCFDELNLTNPDIVSTIHKAYVNARADILETNTFGATSIKLKPHGLEDKVFEINKRGAELAKQAAGDQLYVAGAIGPLGVPVQPLGKLANDQVIDIFTQQIEGLLAGNIDLFILETFSDLHELVLAIQAIRKISDKPVIAQMTFDQGGKTLPGAEPRDVVTTLLETGADIVGANCSVGPHFMLKVIEKMAQAGAKYISAQPNAGNPRIVDGRYLYMSTPEYHAEYAKRLIQAGARIIGGCCGTTPEHIKAIVNSVRALQPQKKVIKLVHSPQNEITVQPVPREEKSALAARMNNKFVVSVEVLSPRGTDSSQVLAGIKKLVGFGVDAINIPDGPRASARMSPLALAQLIERSLPVETILHYCCRDRNLLGMQSDLLGAYALGLKNILALTGDPPKLGDYPDATAVFDIDSIGLTRFIQNLNHGIDIAGKSIGEPTGWHVGVGANPGAEDLEREIDRLLQKIEAGAEYILTQPLFDVEQLLKFFDKLKNVDVPFIAGIMPLISYRTIEFLNNEVPGVYVPDAISNDMKNAADIHKARDLGVKIAQQAILDVKNLQQVKGVYLMPPFTKGKYDIAVQVLSVLK